ncbi:MAG TPA: EAL domain-containing protein [Baekduia sp.]|nr:EAL domain-containing protein [Baekduia sp.]
MTHPQTTARPLGSAAVIDPRAVPHSGIDSFWELATDLFAICGRDGMLYALNPAWERLLGWSREDLTTRSLLAFVHPDDVEATVDVLSRTHIAGSKIDELVNRWRRRDGSYCTLAWSGASDGDVWCVVGRDVTGHAQERTLLREAQRIVELTNWEWHLDSDIVTTNFVAKVLVGDEPITPFGLDGILARVAPQDRDAVLTGLDALRAGTLTSTRLEHRVLTPSGELRWLDSRCRLLRDPAGNPSVVRGTSQDITERVIAREQLERASDDALNARNHLAAVTDSMGEGLLVLDSAGCVTLMNEAAEEMLGWRLKDLRGRVLHDLVHYRRPDGSPQPAAASTILQTLELRATIRAEDEIFIRRDGTELPTSYTAAPLVTSEGPEGCVIVFTDATVRQAEQRELRRKLEALSWAGRVQDALREERFVLYAQPILDLATDEVVQHELLLRMREPNGEIVGPGSYLQIAEEHNLIGDIDRWVIRRASRLAARGLPVELNVSGGSISDPELITHIEACLQETGADPALMVFEITETALVCDEEAGRHFVQRVHELGCKLALDDFGTGYGGFTYLKQLPVDYLKIDIEFVRDLRTSEASLHVVEAVVNLARGFGMHTVAEGVEDAETLSLLKTLGVDYAQGYHIARPGPLEDAFADDTLRSSTRS